MKYENIAEKMHSYDFVFYETDAKAKKMYIYCPNCGQTYEHDITKVQNVSWIKKNYRPCECFLYRGQQPCYKQTCYAHESLNRSIAVAEFQNDNGEAVLRAYWHRASFGASNYEMGGGYFGDERPYAFRREPNFTNEKVIEITFKNDGTVTYYTSIYIPMCTRSLHSGEWRKAARWRVTSFIFDVIGQSLCELKGTNLEQYTKDVSEFAELLSSNTNTEMNLNEACVAFLILMHTSQSAKKLWKAGYKNYVLNRAIETMLPNNYNAYYYSGYYTCEPTAGVINWRGKTIERILKIEPQKLDLICERDAATVEELRATQFIVSLEKYGVGVNVQNVAIASAGKMKNKDMMRIYSETRFPLSKMFKYIRHQAKFNGADLIKIDSATNDYCDYLEMLKKLKTPFTSDVVFPTNLKRAHDTAVATLKAMHNELKDDAFKAATMQFCALSYTSDKYSIKPIITATQLSKEAQRMHNCSAGYIDKIIDGECVLFAIRQKAHPRKPFFMLELNVASDVPRIIQNRGVGGGPGGQQTATGDIADFAAQWLNKIVMPYMSKGCTIGRYVVSA